MVSASGFSMNRKKIEQEDKEGGCVDSEKVFKESLFEEVAFEQRSD